MPAGPDPMTAMRSGRVFFAASDTFIQGPIVGSKCIFFTHQANPTVRGLRDSGGWITTECRQHCLVNAIGFAEIACNLAPRRFTVYSYRSEEHTSELQSRF